VIAISYRREDTLPIAGRLYDRLQADFGKGNVFMDFDSIPYGVDFREHIKQMIDRSKVLVALIGPDWFGRRTEQTRRIDDPTDFVRLEIAYAFEREIPVIPVLINDTPMPKPADLPPEIEALAFRNAVNLHVGLDFHPHTDRLVAGINRLIIESARSASPEVYMTETRRQLEMPRAPTVSRKPSPPERSKSPPESPAGLSRKPPPVEKSRPAREVPAPRTPSQRQPWTTIPRGWASIKVARNKQKNLIIFDAIAVVALLVGILSLYFGSPRF
jgi:hypothetical protein